MQSQEEHAPSTITFDQKTLISTAALGDLSDRTLTRIATFLEPSLDTWLCPDRMVKVVYIKAATGDNAAVHLSATVPATSRPSIESFLELQLEEPGRHGNKAHCAGRARPIQLDCDSGQDKVFHCLVHVQYKDGGHSPRGGSKS